MDGIDTALLVTDGDGSSAVSGGAQWQPQW